MSETWRQDFALVNGVRLHYVTQGEGELLILLHGFPEFWYSWRHQIPVLAEMFQVVAVDLRGYNESDKPAGIAAYRMEELVADVRGLMSSFGSERAVIVGHDWGGAVAWAFALKHPDRTRALVVMNCPHPAVFRRHLRSNPRQLLRSWYIFFFRIPWVPEWLIGAFRRTFIRRTFRGLAVDKAAFSDDCLRRYEKALAQPGALRSAIHYYRAALAPLLRRGDEEPRRIECPTLVIWGEQDVALGVELTYDMAPLFAGPFELRYIPDCSHWVQQEQPDLVNRYLVEFLAHRG